MCIVIGTLLYFKNIIFEKKILEQDWNMDIAIVGIGCKCPGGIDNMEDLWNVMLEKRDVIGPVPLDRWDTNAIKCKYQDIVGKDILNGIDYGGFMSPAECHALTGFVVQMLEDFKSTTAPNSAGERAHTALEVSNLSWVSLYEKLLLYVTYKACFEYGQFANKNGTCDDNIDESESKSGESSDVLRDLLKCFQGKCVGYFVGGPGLLNKLCGEAECRQAWLCAGGDRESMSLHAISSRVASLLGLHGGPCITTDTACSSSLVAMDLAVNSLQRGEIDVAVVAAAHVVRLEMSVSCAVAGLVPFACSCIVF